MPSTSSERAADDVQDLAAGSLRKVPAVGAMDRGLPHREPALGQRPMRPGSNARSSGRAANSRRRWVASQARLQVTMNGSEMPAGRDRGGGGDVMSWGGKVRRARLSRRLRRHRPTPVLDRDRNIYGPARDSRTRVRKGGLLRSARPRARAFRGSREDLPDTPSSRRCELCSDQDDRFPRAAARRSSRAVRDDQQSDPWCAPPRRAHETRAATNHPDSCAGRHPGGRRRPADRAAAAGSPTGAPHTKIGTVAP